MRSLVIRASTLSIALAAMFAVAGCGDDAKGSMNNPAPRCGDGNTDSGEECDDGNAVDGDGCDSNCKFSCSSTDATRSCGSATDDCKVANTCNDATHKCVAGGPVTDGQTCESGAKVCIGGTCQATTCGDGFVAGDEECDDNTAGCDANCKFTCLSTDPVRDCSTVTDECHVATACNDAVHTCTGGQPVPNFQHCDGDAKVCLAGVCSVPPVCGNGVREFGEQCDDGNTISLDGCDNNCQFEESQRITSLVQQFGTDDFCPMNALGSAITADTQVLIQFTWDGPVAVGDISLVFKFLGLQSLIGEDSPFTLGFVKARAGGRTLAHATTTPDGTPLTPVCGNGICEESDAPGLVPSEGALGCPMDCVYDGTSDLDWWYIRDAASVDANEVPLQTLDGQIVNHHLTAGPGNITVNLEFAFQPTEVSLFNTIVDAAVDGDVNKPLMASGGVPPGHLASEHLDPGLVTVSGSTTGKFCSQVSAGSLANTPASLLLRSQCTQPDSDPVHPTAVYTSDNSVLDVFLSGCVAGTSEGNPPVILVTQPDGSLDHSVYKFTVDPDTRKVNGCSRDDASAELQDCLAQATYSSYFAFATDRVIVKRN